jgi:hypothetical protein
VGYFIIVLFFFFIIITGATEFDSERMRPMIITKDLMLPFP